MLDDELCPTPGAWTAVAPCGLLTGASDGDAAGGEPAIAEDDGAEAGASDGLVVGKGAAGEREPVLVLGTGFALEGEMLGAGFAVAGLAFEGEVLGAMLVPEGAFVCGAAPLA